MGRPQIRNSFGAVLSGVGRAVTTARLLLDLHFLPHLPASRVASGLIYRLYIGVSGRLDNTVRCRPAKCSEVSPCLATCR